MEKRGKRNVYLIIGIVVVVIIIIAIALFFVLRTDGKESLDNVETTDLKNQELNQEIPPADDLETTDNEDDTEDINGPTEDLSSIINADPIDCGQIPPECLQETATEEKANTYFQTNSEVKESLQCSSDNFKDCTNSKLRFIGAGIVNFYSNQRTTDNRCLLTYESGSNKVACVYSLDQTTRIYDITDAEGKSWATTIGLSVGFAFELLRFERGKSFTQDLINKDTAKVEKIPCKFFSVSDKVSINDFPTAEDVANNQAISDATTIVAREGRVVEIGEPILTGVYYQIYYPCSDFSMGCNDTQILSFCTDKCEENEYEARGYNTLEHGVVECNCK